MNLWEANIRKVVPYVPGEQPDKPGMIKLNTNENPYPPSPKVLEALEDFPTSKLRLYPDPTCDVLVEALAKEHGVDKKQIFTGVGSDDVLAIAFLTFFNGNKSILFPDITYSFYDVWADLFRIPYERPALDKDFKIKKEDYYKENGGVVIANPNAPTGVSQDLNFIKDILSHNQDVIVIVDEAYVDFGGESAINLIHDYENLLVVQTFSKSRSLAGMRIGYAAGSKTLIKAMNDVKYSFNSYTMNETALVLGVASLHDRGYFDGTVKKVIATRERVKTELAKLGFIFPDSKTNFIFAQHTTIKAEVLYQALREKDIYVRHFKAARIHNYLRISIGTDMEMDTLLEFLKEYTENMSYV